MRDRDQEIIDRSMAALSRSKAHRMNDAQLQANIDTYRSSKEGSSNWRWRQVCLAERQARER